MGLLNRDGKTRKERKEEKRQLKADRKEREDYFKNHHDFAVKAGGDLVYFNDTDKKIYFKRNFVTQIKEEFLQDYSNLANYRENIMTGEGKKKHGITRAVVGGAVAGGAGAIVGAGTAKRKPDVVKRMSLTILFKDNSFREVTFLDSDTKTDSMIYQASYNKLAQLETKLDSILAAQEQEAAEQRSNT
ncbi:SHOCT domain-containing protein [Tetragenococcus halophilus]|nr:SHOCT domain-containing protein [Tetragenococcus halophilus]